MTVSYMRDHCRERYPKESGDSDWLEACALSHFNEFEQRCCPGNAFGDWSDPDRSWKINDQLQKTGKHVLYLGLLLWLLRVELSST